MAIRVFVGADHHVYGKGLVESIRDRAGLDLIGEAPDGERALTEIRELRPDVAVIDLLLPGIDGMSVLRALRESECETRVVLLSAYPEGALIYEAMQGGASGYLAKDSAAEEIARRSWRSPAARRCSPPVWRESSPGTSTSQPTAPPRRPTGSGRF